MLKFYRKTTDKLYRERLKVHNIHTHTQKYTTMSKAVVLHNPLRDLILDKGKVKSTKSVLALVDWEDVYIVVCGGACG